MIDFRNINTVWASVLVETLAQLGLKTAILCPGSRSTPLTIAFAQHYSIETIPILDERSAAFFALGIAKKSGLPTVLVCTSGTAGANFYPAIIEAKESRVPLLILTADRPPELRDCHAGQTIDQVRLYNNYPNFQTELSIPSLDLGLLGYLRQTLIYAWERSQFPISGVVHLNIPFRDPLHPVFQPETEALKAIFPDDFFAKINLSKTQIFSNIDISNYLKLWYNYSQGIIVAGVAQPENPEVYCQAIAHLSQHLNYPVLAEGLSPVRNYYNLNPYLISTYDLILRNSTLAEKLAPEVVIQVGDLPTSKTLRNWLEQQQPDCFILDPSYQNLDGLHGKTTHLRISIEQLSKQIDPAKYPKQIHLDQSNLYANYWYELETQSRNNIDKKLNLTQSLIEPKAAWLLSQILPKNTPIFISNSMPVRDVEFFWCPNNLNIQPFFNRGANGIDGTLSTALGIAHHQQSSILLTGDLALLHDTNGFLIRNKFIGHLTIILINNNGGGIFEMLPISQFDPPFEEYFTTPQNINFAQLAVTYNIEYEQIQSWEQLQQKLNPLPQTGIRILEIPTNRKTDTQWRQKYLKQLAEGLTF
ncbi:MULTISPECIES: 2-succinyl-5-enolpyruvyl-6-hydroxy-3-cyclohexene-1-carboxylic-acid synthase [Planktothrix]|jgi:2-succinyl-5-enolpyruvyl-6-hydroxy-3-cyclohexene-1-carboxylate synthase|uniref:2-succinyl-5-enolpyruvyl-6-hydroxy-3-cyclohexene-1-carboxylate synthase n=2 Tax=Planktothrix TaxID=54304 RepID=A0A4P5ZGG5_PLAAG|nr:MULTISPECIES: 2-succinyl-5-enolpyruvyl-6-hydroxy-3-cyclohexene-1-carboxylic-acid synthase [Planktothrix]GDZ95246.1 2-succinyl-6-hydroxy-2, 4-cyclohexadiene-1-carboxylic acid synthase/2-oxoglutarate decarboxylase [Planktothrix agardhii CCAP 1459/11A]CAC5343045.1 2-succinyl-5-enolpyruvyl-6-hydroxy-3-cyclohexene-1-carboxylate synthase [Planktothrix rubescens NIVA-CYA 18]CAD5968597.1 2-succinyl-5-enolpyruvyl-6-hydroxy-3-cyclohexene-1-carboxylate synthase [Planktothrix rubescens]CAD5976079.1 2-su